MMELLLEFMTEQSEPDPLENLKNKWTKYLEIQQQQFMEAYNTEKTRMELRLERETFIDPTDLTESK